MKRCLIILVIFKICAAILYSFVGFAHPHIARQSVTMAVNQRYAIDWSFHNKSYPLLPRSLAGGDKDAILEMEFPFMNLITAPAFFLKTEQARVACRLLYIFLMIGLWWLNHLQWRRISLVGISCEIPSLLLILLPISGVYFHRFMPDFFSFILCLLSVGVSLRYPEKIFAPLLLASLGLLEKPPAIIVFGLLLLLPSPLTQIRRRLIWLIPSGALMLLYYTAGTKWLRSLTDLDPYYATGLRNPWQSLLAFLSQPIDILKLVLEQITSPFLPAIVGLYWVFNRKDKAILHPKQLWGLLALQFFAVALMDGAHSFVHSYYYIGAAMTAALLLTYYLQEFKSKAWRVFLLAPLFFFNIEKSIYELRDAFYSRPQSTELYWNSCKALKDRHPDWPWRKGYSFRSEQTPVAEISVCFGEIQGSTTSQYGFFLKTETLPTDCTVIDQENDILLTTCVGHQPSI